MMARLQSHERTPMNVTSVNAPRRPPLSGSAHSSSGASSPADLPFPANPDFPSTIATNVHIIMSQLVIGIVLAAGGVQQALGKLLAIRESIAGTIQGDVICAVAHQFSVDDAMLLLDVLGSNRGKTIIILAAVQNQAELVRRLAPMADWTKAMHSASQALIRAAENGAEDAVATLLDFVPHRGRPINGYVRILALRHARRHRYYGIVELFDNDATTLAALATIDDGDFSDPDYLALLDEMYIQSAVDDSFTPDTAPMA
ncbi:uncharacterized protein AMSG_02946 [Thecamonas trahens ATCC 50062]|uniref:Uncharacterized protein n=1 Tax=Thecamonas trahens ATCC 50062 TaxID=461836 RepID=A0A0L0D2V4_THETB|nr:hypothetical protein AMSG_02946 [Thecamonas trahens ATCC 50062]KNC46510.1 hypothetical protein AMSG_02946 [Thecamonas trahens ATCC 50062]|eukprot:XP_013760291.1 hypothetical protein AMSG_02946 [Thecamonas trahens ATCC 50062]